MTRRSTVWLALVLLFVAINLGGAVYAFWKHEMPHGALHVGLFVVGVYLAWLVVAGGRARTIGRRDRAAVGAPPSNLTNRLDDLERSVDVVAVEVERVGEAQRFMTRVFTEQGAEGRAPEAVAIDAPVPKPAR